MKKQFKISDEEIKRMYLSGSSLSDIAKVAQDNKGLMSLRKRLHELGVSTKRNPTKYSDKFSHRIYSLNEHAFDVIDTEEKAYWLGFLFADGYNNEKKHRIEISLQQSDYGHLEKFKEFLETEVPVKLYQTKGYTKAVFGITSRKLSESLAKIHGCVQAKTHIRFYPIINDELNRHFIRGYFDGNGSFSHTTTTEDRWQISITGNKNFILVLKYILERQANVKETKLNTRNDKPSVAAHYSGKHVCERIMKYLYEKSCVYLQRKYDKYCKLYLGGATRNNNKPREFMETPTSSAEDNHEPSPILREGATTIPKGSTLKRVEVRGSEKSDDDIV